MFVYQILAAEERHKVPNGCLRTVLPCIALESRSSEIFL